MTITEGLAEGQVLQRLGSRGATLQISGRASETGPLLATISGAKATVKGWKARPVGRSANGTFTATLPGIPAGGPYRLELRAGREKALTRQFFVGDVWLLAGQSNMEGVGNMNAPAEPHPLIRAFSMRREWRLATDPIHVLAESPDACHNGGVQRSRAEAEALRKKAVKGVGAGIFFAREMLEITGVPQGLLATAHGGTSMAQWDPVTGEMYRSMLASVRATGQPLAGVLWYQGESEAGANEAPLYADRMKKLVAAMRRDFALPRLPWVIVQISRFHTERTDPYWNQIQELQRLLPGQIQNLEMVSAIDLSLDDGIHIGAEGFATLGPRVAIAMRRFHGGSKLRPPQLGKISAKKSKYGQTIEVTFLSVEKGLKAEGAPQGFSLARPDGTPVPFIFKTTLHGNMARLHCDALPPGLVLHYGLGTHPICNITDGRNLSLPVFGPVPISPPGALADG